MFKVAFRVIVGMLANMCPSDPIRASLYRFYGVNIGDDVFIGRGVMFDRVNPEQIHIGDRCTVAAHTLIMAHRDIPSPTPLKQLYPSQPMPVVIEADCVLFPGTVVAPGVRIGHHSAIASGTVIHKDVAPYSLVAGSGFRVVRQFTPEEFERAATS
jgi:acetyltransferase-like isoleucine patch superfamily enzyme